MRQFVHSVAWKPFCPQKRIKSDWASSLAVWNSSYPFVHRTLLAAVSGIDISLTASLSLSHPPLPSPPSTLHFAVSLLHMFQDYPQSSVLLAPGLTCGGGRKMETREARKKKKPWGTCKPFHRHPLLTVRRTPLSESWQTVNPQIKANDSCVWQLNKTTANTIAQKAALARFDLRQIFFILYILVLWLRVSKILT